MRLKPWQNNEQNNINHYQLDSILIEVKPDVSKEFVGKEIRNKFSK